MTEIINLIMSYEAGDLDKNKILELFAELIKTGQAWHLQGHYGRTAAALIKQGFIDKNGKILRQLEG